MDCNYRATVCSAGLRRHSEVKGWPHADRHRHLALIMQGPYAPTVAYRTLGLCLLFAAVLGLAGESAAIAASQPLVHETVVSSLTDDCLEMMAPDKAPPSKPCDGSFKCMLAMGCLSANMILHSAVSSPERLRGPAQAYWPAVAVLRGESLIPETHPPTFG